MKKKKIKLIILAIVAILVVVGIVLLCIKSEPKTELRSIKSEKELETVYGEQNYSEITQTEKVLKMLAVPFYAISEISSNFGYDGIQEQMNSQLSARELQYVTNESVGGITALATDSASNSKSTTSTSKDYSTTNIQVENVDEADIIKTHMFHHIFFRSLFPFINPESTLPL